MWYSIINNEGGYMTLEDFIDENRNEIDDIIKSIIPNFDFDDEERENWIMNDEGLYGGALSGGVVDI